MDDRELNGIHVLTVDDGSGLVARGWLDANGADAMLPPYYASDDVLLRHVDRAVRSVSQFLSNRRHTNRVSGAEFRGIVYLADDPAVKPYSVVVRGVHVVVIGLQWLYQLVAICDHLAAPLANRPRSGPPRPSPPATPRDDGLSELLNGKRAVSADDAIRIARQWPDPAISGVADDLGPWAVFYDLIRLVWFHELAHALCGHIAFAKDELRLMALYESTANDARESSAPLPVDGPPAQVLQCLELHADEFAVRSSLGEILYGHDPAGLLVRDGVDLGDRLLHLNTAFCVFALLWALDERRTRRAPAGWTDLSHPPVALRYDRFRGFQRQFALEYDPRLVTVADVLSLSFLEPLTQASPLFADLYRLTPLIVRTPSMDDVEQYETHLMRLEPAIAAHLERQAYVPAEFLGS